MRGAVALVCSLCLTGPSFARTGTPGPGYFAGSYDVAGVMGGALMQGHAQLLAQGQGVVLRRCDAADIALGFGPAFEIENLMTGRMGTADLECLFHNNGYNRPILTCRSTDGAAFTLWPAQTAAHLCP